MIGSLSPDFYTGTNHPQELTFEPERGGSGTPAEQRRAAHVAFDAVLCLKYIAAVDHGLPLRLCRLAGS